MRALDFGSLGVGEFICPSCGLPVTLQEGTCPNCGYDLVAYRKANGITQPPLSSAAPSAAASANFGTIDFGSQPVPVAKSARQLLASDVIEFDVASVAAPQSSAPAVAVRQAAAATQPVVHSSAEVVVESEATPPFNQAQVDQRASSAAAANTDQLVPD